MTSSYLRGDLSSFPINLTVIPINIKELIYTLPEFWFDLGRVLLNMGCPYLQLIVDTVGDGGRQQVVYILIWIHGGTDCLIWPPMNWTVNC